MSSFTRSPTALRRVRMRRARSAREIGWCDRTRLSAIRRLISREVPRVATLKFRGSIRRITTPPGFVPGRANIRGPRPGVQGKGPEQARKAAKYGLLHLYRRGSIAVWAVNQGCLHAIQADRQRQAEHGGRARGHAAALGPARHAGPEGTEVRLRHRPVRRL